MDHTCLYRSPLGDVILTSDGEALTGLRFDGQISRPSAPDAPGSSHPLPIFETSVRWLDVYFGGGVPDFTPALRPEGTDFQRQVWALLLTVPYGRTVTYGALAKALAARTGRPRVSPRAVGGAAGRNPIALIVPCHRVIGADGSLTGYAWGQDRKRRLLDLEQAGGPTSAEPEAPADLFHFFRSR